MLKTSGELHLYTCKIHKVAVSFSVLYVQFVVGEDGSWGLLYEHATAEGPPIATLLDHVLEYWYLQKLHKCMPFKKDKNTDKNFPIIYYLCIALLVLIKVTSR